MKILDGIARILLGLLFVLPILGTLGVFPPPTADMYTPEGWAYMSALMQTGFMLPALGVTFAVSLVLLILNRTALMALLLSPLTVNILLFHLFLDATPISGASSMAYVLLVLNGYFLWRNREKYRPLW